MIIEHFRGEHGLKQALNTMLKLKSENPQYYYALYPLDETLFDEWKENGYGVYTSMWWTNTPMFYQVLNKKYSFIPVSIDPVEKIVSDAAFDIEILGLFGTRLENAEWCINQEDAIAGVILNFDRDNKPVIKKMVDEFNMALDEEGCDPEYLLTVKGTYVSSNKDFHKLRKPIPSGFFYYLSAGKYDPSTNDSIRKYYVDFLLSLNPFLKKYDFKEDIYSVE